MTKLSEYMHTAEAAKDLGVHHNTIRKWAAPGEIQMNRANRLGQVPKKDRQAGEH